MRKNICLFAFLMSLCLHSTAQPVSLCNAFGALAEESHSKFSNLAGENVDSENNYQRNASTFKMKDADGCYLESNGKEVFWIAEFGSFNSQEEAQAKIKTLQEEFIACSPNIEFVKTFSADFLPVFSFKEKLSGGFTFYKGELGIFQDKEKKFVPFFKMPENASPVTFANITTEPDTSAFTKGIENLLTQSHYAFRNIQGNQISSDVFLTTYNATFCLTGALHCEISEGISDRTYEAYYGLNLFSTDADTLLVQAENAVGFALGKKYVWNNIENGMGFTEITNAGEKSVPLIEVKKEKADGDKFDVLIRIKQR